MSFPQGGFLAGDVQARTTQGILGGRVTSDYNDRLSTLVNKDPQANQVDTVTVSTVTNSVLYTFEIGDITVSYTSDATATDAEISAGLKAAFDADPIAGGLAVCVNTSATVLTFTGIYPGQSYTLAAADVKLTAASVTSAAEAEAVEYARAMITSGYSTTESIKYGGMAKSSAFAAQVITLDYTYVAGKRLVAEVIDKHTGAVYRAEVVQAVDQATSSAALVVQLNGILPANFVLAAGVGAITLTAELAGLEFAANLSSDDDLNVAPSVTPTTGPSLSTSLLRAFQGVSIYSEDNAAASIGATTANYGPNEGVKNMEKGPVWVASSQTLVNGSRGYVEMDGTGSDFAKFYNDDGATRLALPIGMARWERRSRNSAENLGALFVDALNQPS
jgi:hypothetical protein